jgi:glucose-1-phosphate adenylyltransferase
MRKTVAFLLAGGMGSRLNVLGWMRAKPAVPFGGHFRIIDFTMSNIMHSGINVVGILTQYRPHSLMNHIDGGQAWDLTGRTRTATILPPSTGINDQDWYRGTADAVAQNLSFAHTFGAQRLLVLSGDHIYKMNYEPLIEFHKQKEADITIAMMQVPWEETRHFGIGLTDKNYRIVDWEEKPLNAGNNLASMGIYVFDLAFIEQVLKSRRGHDFGKHIINDAIQTHRVFAYPFQGYWADVGTLKAYWETNMDVLRPESHLNLRDWKIRTNFDEQGRIGDRPPMKIGNEAVVKHSIISQGCVIEGTVIHSILSPGVVVKKNAVVQDSILMHNCHIDESVHLYQTIADKRTHFCVGSRVGQGQTSPPNRVYPEHLYSGLTVVGKEAVVPAHHTVYPNTIIEPFVDEHDYPDRDLGVGDLIQKTKQN